MEIESAAFTIADLNAFLDEMQDHDRHLLANRLESASRRLGEIGARVNAGRGDGKEWSDHELLAHIATLSKYYGVLVHRVAGGQITELNLLDSVHARDAAIDQAAELPPSDLVRMALTDHERTIKTLRAADPTALRRPIRIDGETTMTAEELARLPLINHLEMHIEQLERSLQS
ncbi:MAG: hypothetical protein AUI15_24670 [Actinobacteria bacterium 13_2_20CM_2_66_6]|nr:MAG: hypothetical protein AUI15_24670 [Actinobacteria bacterium 13_2_20CM_2_66_6]